MKGRKPKNLNEQQKEFILSNYNRVTLADIARELDVFVHDVYKVLRVEKIKLDNPSRWGKEPISGAEKFNVNKYSNWVL